MVGEALIREALGQEKPIELGDIQDDSGCSYGSNHAAATESVTRSVLYDAYSANRISMDRGNELSYIRGHYTGNILDIEDI